MMAMKRNDCRFCKKYIFFLLFVSIIFIPKQGVTQEHSLWKDLGIYGGQIKSLAIDPSNPQIMYAGSWGGDGLFKTADGGASWHVIPQDNPSWFRNIEVHDIEIDPSDPQTIWVANNHYVDASHDGGATWKTFYFADDEGRFCYSVAVDPFDSDRVYVGTGGPDDTDEYGEVFITETSGGADGKDWHSQGFHDETLVWNNFWQIKFNPNKQGETWLANRKSFISPDGLALMTGDGGEHWYYWANALWTDGLYYKFGYIDEVLVHPTDIDKIFLSSGEGIAIKENSSSGWTWTPIIDDCRALSIPPGEPSTIYAALSDTIAISKNCGAGWDEADYKPAPSEFLTMEPHPTDPATLFAGSLNQGVQKTADRADTWSTINSGIKANTVFDTAVDSANQERIQCGTLAGIFLKENSTAAWKHINKNDAATVAFDPLYADTMYAGFDWSIGKSTDKGASWTYQYTADQVHSNKVTSIAVDKTNASLFATVAFSSGNKGQLLKIQHTSAPFDEDATPSVILETPLPLNAVAISPHDPSFMIAVSGSFYAPAAPGGMFISSNGGDTWNRQSLPGKYVLNCIAFDPSNSKVIYAGAGGSDGNYAAVLKSTDGGSTWLLKNGGMPSNFAVKDMKVTSDGSKVYAVLYKGYSNSHSNLGGTYVSLDGGTYWTRVGLSDYRMYDISLADAGMASTTLQATTPVPAMAEVTYTVYAGSGSGLMNEDPSTIAGSGIITGKVTTVDGLPLSDVYLTSTAGTGAQTDRGIYLMLCPSGTYTIQASAPGYLQISDGVVQVAAGGSSPCDIMMEPFDDNSSSTCISANMLRNTPESRYLAPLRAFRDSVLKKSLLGNEIISRYYGLGGDIVPILHANARLKGKCRKLLGRAAEIILARADKPLSLPRGFMDEASAFLFELEKQSPQQVRNKIKKLRCDMRHLKLEGLQVRQ